MGSSWLPDLPPSPAAVVAGEERAWPTPSTCPSTTSSPRAGAPTNGPGGEALPPEAEAEAQAPHPRHRDAASTPVLRQHLTSAAQPSLFQGPCRPSRRWCPLLTSPPSSIALTSTTGVSNNDIKELFSDVGHIKRYSINCDRSRRSKGTAEVIFSRRSDALAAVKRYNKCAA
ncbi:hypothetical protein BDA96_08G000300 [Sorghum bicolor]|uniref:RRM domain-containing protein n=2 Tax=Sorghum bicolor TaxID=4558 RepID=A0A921U645_SORBI|nr:uncharacterized protein LOC8155439 [Sorghum bicolor]KAG0519594.1 hypothetical protein BDA96_08G000300 [Sorghum bicolor]OQU75650.1 hypothetical protein SORBI_3K010000 [Sorghum bicolor]|eukprot:XP_021306321.1 uncharacterized protein LOC8155439 [Sorghum bicolor]